MPCLRNASHSHKIAQIINNKKTCPQSSSSVAAREGGRELGRYRSHDKRLTGQQGHPFCSQMQRSFAKDICLRRVSPPLEQRRNPLRALPHRAKMQGSPKLRVAKGP